MNDLIKKFEEGHTKMGGELHLCTQKDLLSVLKKILTAEKNALMHKGLIERFQLNEEELSTLSNLKIINPADINRDSWRETIRQATASVTHAVALIAFSGTVVVSSAMDHSRLFSLSPQRNIVIAYEDQLVKDLDEFWIKYVEDPSISGSQIVFVTGTSRTADIEKKLIRGVHGPKYFDVIIVKK